MTKHSNGYESGRMFIDETFFLCCPQCLKDFQFKVASNLKRQCIACKKIQLLINFKYDSDTSYRNICNVCKGKQKKDQPSYAKKLTYTMMPCGTCLEEGKSLAEATVRVNSKGIWDVDGLHIHQKGIYKKDQKEDRELQVD